MRLLTEYDIVTHPRYRQFGSASPLDVANCVCWLRAEIDLYQDSSFVTPADEADDPIGGWKDQSGNSNHFTTAGTARPLLKLATVGGYDSAKFDGSDDYLSRASALVSGSVGTIFVVANCPGASTHGCLFGVGTSNNGWKMGVGATELQDNGNDVIGLIDQKAWIDSNQTYGTGDKVVTVQKASSSVLYVWVDGALKLNYSGQVPNTPSAVTYLGSRAFAGGYISWYIAEVVIYNRNLTGDEIDEIEQYLGAKFDISV